MTHAAISLYDISVATYLQTLGAVTGFLEKGRAHCEANDLDLDDIVGTRLYADMAPFAFQIRSVVHHSLGALQGIQAGTFQPPSSLPDCDYSGLQQLVNEALDALQRFESESVDAMAGAEVVFHVGDRQLPFTAENFVLSFSLPNFYFHAATAYDILRMKGVPLGKRDFIGRLRLSAP